MPWSIQRAILITLVLLMVADYGKKRFGCQPALPLYQGNFKVYTTRLGLKQIGSQELLYVSAGKHTFVAEIQEISGETFAKRALVEKEIELAFNMDKLHLFDPETEIAVYNP